MDIVGLAIRNARLTLAIMFFFLVAGALAYQTVPKEAEPDIQIPIIYVSLAYQGISPEDSERLLLRPVETRMKGLANVKEMRSAAYQGGGYVLVEFNAGADLSTALEDVRAKVQDAKRDLPQAAEEPTVNEVNLSEFPVLVVTLSGNVPERALTAAARDLRDRIEEVPGVLEAVLQGAREDLVEVIVDPHGPVALARDAIALARTGADADVILRTLHAGLGALVDYAPPAERLPLATELATAAIARGDRALAIQSRARAFIDRMELGDVSGADGELAGLESIAREVGHPRYLWRPALLKAMRAIMTGRFNDAERLRAEAAALGSRTEDPALAGERHHRQRAVAAPGGLVSPGSRERVGGDVVADGVTARGQRVGREGAPGGRPAGDELAHDRHRALVGAGVSAQLETAVRIDQADVGHAEASGLDGNAARGREDRRGLALPHDRLVDGAQHGIDAIELADALLGLGALGDVLDRADHFDQLATGAAADRSLREQRPGALARPRHPVLGAVLAGAGAHRLFEPVVHTIPQIVRVDHRHHRIERRRHVARQGEQFVHLIRPDERAAGQVAPAADAGVALRLLESLLVLAHRGFRRLPRRDVEHDAAHPYGATVLVEHELAARLHPMDTAVGPDDAELALERRAVGAASRDVLLHAREVVGVDAVGKAAVGAGKFSRRVAPELFVQAGPDQVVRDDVPLERAHVRRVEGQPQLLVTVDQEARVPLQLELRHHLAAERRERANLRLVELTGHQVHHADGADHLPFRRAQRRRRIEADLRRTRHERVVGEAWVQRGVGHHHDRRHRLQQVRAERHVPGGLARLEPESRLEPLPVVVDERDQGDRRLADVGGKGGQVVERLLRRSVEHAVLPKYGQPCLFVSGSWRNHAAVDTRGLSWRIVRPSSGFCQCLDGASSSSCRSGPMRMSRVVSPTTANVTSIAFGKGRVSRSGHSMASTPSRTPASSRPRSSAPPDPSR
mgnify:CR=1 FL=1